MKREREEAKMDDAAGEIWSFTIKVNDGPPQQYESANSAYVLVVMEAFGKLGMPYPCDVEIWSPSLLPNYGPYFYRIGDFVDNRGNIYGCPSVMSRRPPNPSIGRET